MMLRTLLVSAFLLGSHFSFSQVAKHAYRVIGQKDFNTDSINQGGTITAKGLNSPAQVLIAGGKFIIADAQNNRVLVFDSFPVSNNDSATVVIGQANFSQGSSNRLGPVGAHTLDRPAGLGSDGTRLFILDRDNHRVLIYNKIPDSSNASADIVIGQRNMNEDSAGGESVFNDTAGLSAYRLSTGPTGMFYDQASGKLIVADSDNDRILIYNKIPDTNWAQADVVIGQPDFFHNKTNQGGPVAANTLDLSTAASVSVYNGKLFVCDRQNHRVLIFNQIPTSNNASADVVIGQDNFTANSPNKGGSTSSASLRTPRSVTVDKWGRMYIADIGNNRILIYNSIPTVNGASADAVLGQNDFTSNTGSVSDSTFRSIYHLLAHENTLLVSDAPNNRVLFFEITGPLSVKKPQIQDLTVYPNPVHERLFIRGLHEEACIKVFNLMGQLEHSQVLMPDESVDLSRLPNGVYLCNITLGNSVFTGKLIKQ